jgi:F420H(2)-dependent quinone reductase
MKPDDLVRTAEQYLPSPSQRVRDQVARYEATDGREGGTLEGRPVVILTMTGATSGKIRKAPIMRIERDGTYIAVASAGGAPNHPAWYHNLLANPDVRLQDGAQLYRLRAREIFGDERPKPRNSPTRAGPTSRNIAPKPDAKSRSCSSSLLPAFGSPSSAT